MSLLLKLISYLPFVSLFPSLGKVLSSVFENVMPFMGQVLQGFVWFLKTMWAGLNDVVDDVRTVLFVVCCVIGFGFYTHRVEQEQCRLEIVEIRKKLVPKNPVKTVQEPSWSPFDWLFR